MQQWIVMTSSLHKKIPFINYFPKIEATTVPSFAASGSSILAPATYPFLLINKAGGYFHSLSFSSSPHLPPRDPTNSSAAAAVDLQLCIDQAAASTWNAPEIRTLLRCSWEPGEFSSLNPRSPLGRPVHLCSSMFICVRQCFSAFPLAFLLNLAKFDSFLLWLDP